MMATTPFVILESAAFGYCRSSQPVIAGVSFSASPGDFLVLRGPNGCGKSTIVKGMLGLARTLRGTVQWNIDRTAAGYVPQETAIADDIPFTALDIVRCAAGGAKTTAADALERIGLADKRHLRFGDLSGGQKRRVLFARALAKRPRLLLLDEPTANVDPQTEAVIETVICDLISTRQAAVIAVAHAADFGKEARIIRFGNGGVSE
jgi:ABC-type Mn2+/Zn2+ transport system ATPase subunit